MLKTRRFGWLKKLNVDIHGKVIVNRKRNKKIHIIKKLLMTIHTHPILEVPFVFLPVPTPSLRDQLKLKETISERTQNCEARPGRESRSFI